MSCGKRIVPDIALVAAAIGFEMWLGLHLGYCQSLAKVIWVPPDSWSYKVVAGWLFGRIPFGDVAWEVAARPFGYPLLLAICSSVAPWAIVVVQVAGWTFAQWALFRILRDLTRNAWVAFALAMLSVTGLTAATLPFFALSDSVALSLLGASLYCAHRFERSGRELHLFLLLAMMSVGAIVRPAGIYPFLVVLAVGVGSKGRAARRIPVLLLALLPLVAQSAIMAYHYGVPRLSIIDSVNVDRYLLARADSNRLHMTLAAAFHERTTSFYSKYPSSAGARLVPVYDRHVRREALSYLERHPGSVLTAYLQSMWENLNAASAALEVIRPHPLLGEVSLWQARATYVAGAVAGFLLLTSTLGAACSRRSVSVVRERWFGFFALGLAAYTVLISGTSFWQGDRLLLPVWQPALLLVGLAWRRCGSRGGQRANERRAV